MEVAMLFGLMWLIAFCAPAALRGDLAKCGWWLGPALGVGLLWLLRNDAPVIRLAASSLVFLYLVKRAVLLRAGGPRLPILDRVIFNTVWPGMAPDELSRGKPAPEDTGRRFGRGLTLTIVGVASTGSLALFYPLLPASIIGWLGIAALLLTVHFGFSEVLTGLMRLSGRAVRPLFDHPLRSRTLMEFWGRRWNLAFVEMDRRLFLPALARRMGMRNAVFGVFLVSGTLHEMAISYPAGAGWGLPLLYFAIQCVGVVVERRLRIRSRLWTFAWLLLPLPLLFHGPFRDTLIGPFFSWMHREIASHSAEWYVSLILWTLAPMQLSVLMASYQVPRRLNWGEELPRLSPFNRKLMWTYALFIVASVVAFAILTLVLHNSFLAGERSAIGLAIFMAGFWCLRLGFDAFYYRGEDWPEGVQFQVGHALLNALFVYLVLGYGTAAVWGWLAMGR